MYTGQFIRISWAGVMSNYFAVLNGVKQGGVVSPVLFCIYIDNLLLQLSSSGYGCYLGRDFVGAIAYADDIVLISPTPCAMRKLLFICDNFAAQYDLVFNAVKSKFIVISTSRWRCLIRSFNNCLFSIGGKQIENVSSYVHLGHVINSKFDDNEDIISRRNHFIGQTNDVLCFFNNMELNVKIKLFRAYCSSIYGCELWSLDCAAIDTFCASWRKAIRRLLGLPYDARCYLLPILTNTLSIFDEICKRSAHFIRSCLLSQYKLVRSVTLYSILHGRYLSVIGKNLLFCCKRFSWNFDDFLLGDIDWVNEDFMIFNDNKLQDVERSHAQILAELISLREGSSVFDTGDKFLNHNEIKMLIDVIATV